MLRPFPVPRLIAFALFGLLSFAVKAQTDSSHWVKVPFTQVLPYNNALCVWKSRVEIIDNDSTWDFMQKFCKENTLKPDFNKYTLWQRNASGDCQAWYTHALFIDSLEKKIIWVLTDHYGGCRAAGLFDFRIQFAKPPAGYTFEMREERVER